MNTPKLHDLFSPDGLEENVDYLSLGPARYARTFVVAVYPREIYVGWLDRIFSLGDVDLSVHIDPVPNRPAAVELTKSVSSAQAQLMIYEKRGDILQVPELKQIIYDLETIRTHIQTNRDKLFMVTVFITLHARSLEELNMKSDELDDILAASTVQIRCLMSRQVDGIKAILPVNNPVISDYWRNMTTGCVTAMMPVTNSDVSHPSGVLLGFNYHSNAPVFFDAFIGPPYLDNQHVAIIGASGSGKSVDIKTNFVLRPAAQGKRILIHDPEGEYSRMVRELIGGRVVRVSTNGITGINPLDVEPDLDDNGRPFEVNINDKVNEVRSLFSAVLQERFNRYFSPQEVTDLDDAIKDAYAERYITSDPNSLYTSGGGNRTDGGFIVGRVKKEMPTLSDVDKHLKNKSYTEDLQMIIRPFLRDGTLGMFDCQSTVDLRDQVNSFDFSSINDKFTRFYSMYILLGWSWQRFAQGLVGYDKIMPIDETWWYMKYKDSAEFVQNLVKRGRKYRTSLVAGSQQIEDFLNNEEGLAVFGNCETQIIHKQKSSLVDNVVKQLKLPEGCQNMLSSFAPGEALVTMGKTTTAVRITPTPYEWPWVQTIRNWKAAS